MKVTFAVLIALWVLAILRLAALAAGIEVPL